MGKRKSNSPLKFSINADKWQLRFNGRIKSAGYCDYLNRVVTIHPTICGDDKGTLGTIVHEITHAVWPHSEEERVVLLEGVLTNVLWELGYRRQLPNGD